MNFFPKTDFYLRQNKATQAYLDRATIWSDKDIAIAFVTGIVFGVVVGLLI
jgi:hypothetical protein